MLEELLIEGYVQPAVEVIAKQIPKAGSDAGQTAFVDVDHCGMSVRVGIYTRLCVNDRDIPEDVVVHAETILPFGGSNEGVFVVGKRLCLIGFLLKDNQVTAYFGACTVCKEVVRQTDGGHQMGMLHELVADVFIRRGVQYALRGDKSQYTPFANVVQSLQKEIVVQALGGVLTDKALALGERGVEDRHIAKGNVGGGDVETVQVTKPTILETSNFYFGFGMKVRENFAGQEVFFKADYFGTG